MNPGQPQSMPLGAPPAPMGPQPINSLPPVDAPALPPYAVEMQEDGSAIWRSQGPNGELGPVVKVAPGPKGGQGAQPEQPSIIPTPGLPRY